MNVQGKNKAIKIACGIDSNYVVHLAAMLHSLAEKNPEEHFSVYVIHNGVDDKLRERVVLDRVEIHWIGVEKERFDNLDEKKNITRATYLRLLIDDLLPRAVNRVLYLDVDMIVDGRIRPLWESDLNGCVCAAVSDFGVDTDSFAEKWKLEKGYGYFNAGVLLFDLNQLRSEGYLKQALNILDSSGDQCEWGDQDVLNIVLWKKWLPMDIVWNFQRKFLYKDIQQKASLRLKSRPIIIHYTEEEKPWKKTEWHPAAWLYLRALRKTSFAKDVLTKAGITPFLLCKWWLRWVVKWPPRI